MVYWFDFDFLNIKKRPKRIMGILSHCPVDKSGM